MTKTFFIVLDISSTDIFIYNLIDSEGILNSLHFIFFGKKGISDKLQSIPASNKFMQYQILAKPLAHFILD